MYICPHCKSRKTKKCGKSRLGKQIYQCNKCGRRSTVGVIYEPKKVCPYCKSNNTKQCGKLKSGYQRYQCKDCNKHFSDITVISKNISCPHCNGTVVKNGFSKTGKQRYTCKSCNKTFTIGRLKKAKKTYDVSCPRCENKKAVKSGKTGDNKQYWTCTKCKHKFLEDSKFKHLTSYQIRQLKRYVYNNTTKRLIASLLGISERTVYYHTKDMESKKQRKEKELISDLQRGKPLYSLELKYGASEHELHDKLNSLYTFDIKDLTEEQLNAIIDFGKKFSIPLEYISELLPVSGDVKKFLKSRK